MIGSFFDDIKDKENLLIDLRGRCMRLATRSFSALISRSIMILILVDLSLVLIADHVTAPAYFRGWW